MRGYKLTDSQSIDILFDEIDKALTLPKDFENIITPFIKNDTANAPNDNYKVYCYTNKINGKKYVGQTKFSLQERAKNDGKGYKNVDYSGKQ